MAAALMHAADCRGADLAAGRDRVGGLLLRCRGCGRSIRLGAPASAAGAVEAAREVRPASRVPRARQEPQERQDPARLVIPDLVGGRDRGGRWPTHKSKRRTARKSARRERNR